MYLIEVIPLLLFYSDGNNVVSAVLAEWPKFSCWWGDKSPSDLQSMALLLLTKLLLIDGKVK